MHEPDSIAGPGRPKRLTCLIAAFHPERALTVALRQNLAEVLPEIAFTLEARAPVDAVWICGYEAGRPRLVRALRERHPDAVVVVTSRDPVEDWDLEVADAGADFAFSWPVAFEVLHAVMRGGLPSKNLRSRRSGLPS